MIDLSDPGEKNLATGMHRTIAAQETVDKILSQKHRFGITRLANVTGLDRIGIPVALAIRPNARSVAVSQGKGMTLEHAKASALMESVEIWHAETFDKPLIFSSFADLSDRHATVDVGRLPETATLVFTDTLRILWAEAFELNSGETRLVPFDMVHTDYTDVDIPGHGCVPCSTNGLASGNHILEAICHGICEVIERDALSVWDAAREQMKPLRVIAPDSVESGDCRTLLDLFNEAQLDCHIWDMTTDIGIATFTVVIRERGETVGHLGLGSGTHPDSTIALRRALTGAAQTRLNYISGSSAFSDVPTHTHATLRGDLDHLLARLEAVGIDEVAVVDLSRENIGIAVAHVIIPGLEAPHDDNAYIPGERARMVAI